ncbi:MAG TPA: hypothetical protein VN880_10205 [Solirubrobacteraceae bacterium]|nr:hypothetical protein [Solirubrobacteraceae bacterium]
MVLDGALCCANVLGATDLVIATDALSVAAAEAVDGALAERYDLTGAVKLTIVEVPPPARRHARV